MKKIVFYNILVLFCLFFLLEMFSLSFAIIERISQLKNPSILNRYKNGLLEYVYNAYTNKYTFLHYDIEKSNFRPVSKTESNKRPILLFGCSVTYGNLLSDDNNFSGILSRITKRPVYNMAQDGWGPAHMLMQLQTNRDLLFIKNPEYIIYTFLSDHKKRLFFYQGWGYSTQLYLRYRFSDDNYIEPISRKYPFYWRFFTTKHIQHYLEKVYSNDEDKVDLLLFRIFEESVKILKTRYPDAKLVLLLYNEKYCSEKNNNVDIVKTEQILSNKQQEKFKELGFEIYNIEEIAGKSFCSKDYHARCPIYGDIDVNHPSSKMWEEFVPKLVTTLKM